MFTSLARIGVIGAFLAWVMTISTGCTATGANAGAAATLTGLWKGEASATATVTTVENDQRTTDTKNYKDEIKAEFNDKGQLLHEAKPGMKVAVSHVGQQIKFTDEAGAFTTLTIREVAFTPEGGRLAMDISANFTRTNGGVTAIRTTHGNWSLDLTKDGNNLKGTLNANINETALVTVQGMQSRSETQLILKTEGVLKKQ